MKYWIMTCSRHHNVEMPNWYLNIKAETEDEAILEGYRNLIRDMIHDDTPVPDISAILTQEEMIINYIDLDYDEEPITFVLWNCKYGNNIINRGLGFGESIDDTDKHENRWFSIEERNDMVMALRAYSMDFDKIPKELLKKVLDCLDKGNK